MPEPVSWVDWCLAVSPLLLLLVLVASGRVRTAVAALPVVLLTGVVGWVHFGAGPQVLWVALGKGAWLGVWIGYVVVPALLLYRVAVGGGLDRIGSVLERVTDRPMEHLLIVAWLTPSLIQGVAGFGVPIALTAPLLLAMGFGPVKSVVFPLVGYCWSVTFGSMASSFYMVALTGHQHTHTQQVELALYASALLGILAIAAGCAVCVLEGGLRGLGRQRPLRSPCRHPDGPHARRGRGDGTRAGLHGSRRDRHHDGRWTWMAEKDTKRHK